MDHLPEVTNPSNAEKMKAIQEGFEKRFGVNSETRTKSQWEDLINTYGIKTVAIQERKSQGKVRRIIAKL